MQGMTITFSNGTELTYFDDKQVKHSFDVRNGVLVVRQRVRGWHDAKDIAAYSTEWRGVTYMDLPA